MIKSVIGSIESPTQVALGRLGLLGDEQAEVGLHGGIDQAIYMYPVEHWAFWQQQRALLGINEAMAFGFVGENLSIEGLLEDDVSAGDRLSIGDVLLQVTGPRIPCIKFNWRMGYAKASKHMIQSGRCGWYCSVLQTGVLVPGASIHLLPGRKLLNIADQLRLQQKHIDRQLELFK
jgi:MOSC domain-containing protein YiiM